MLGQEVPGSVSTALAASVSNRLDNFFLDVLGARGRGERGLKKRAEAQGDPSE